MYRLQETDGSVLAPLGTSSHLHSPRAGLLRDIYVGTRTHAVLLPSSLALLQPQHTALTGNTPKTRPCNSKQTPPVTTPREYLQVEPPVCAAVCDPEHSGAGRHTLCTYLCSVLHFVDVKVCLPWMLSERERKLCSRRSSQHGRSQVSPINPPDKKTGLKSFARVLKSPQTGWNCGNVNV